MPNTSIDLHCHSTASDGTLSPAEVVYRAAENGVKVLSLTDHDTIAGLQEAERAASQAAIKLVPGIELSCEWRGYTVHILGLNFPLGSPVMLEAQSEQTDARFRRAREIARKLQKKGLPDVLTMATELAPSGVPGRPHFAQALVDSGVVDNVGQAFKHYLGAGKPGDIKSMWPSLQQVVCWIQASGGDAVIAHPRKYSMSLTKLRDLISDFKSNGGKGLEVIVSGQKQGEIGLLSDLCQRFELAGSQGSDFHSPKFRWADLGRIPSLPKTVQPIWAGWPEFRDEDFRTSS